jgi:uncharacterized protein YecE (DUF72 family)
MIHFGTLGFSYDDWVGNFYPIGTPKREWLTYYVREFDTCGVNSTFYALPKPSRVKAMVEKTGDGFLFYIKANQEMTHQQEDNAKKPLSPPTITGVGRQSALSTNFR